MTRDERKERKRRAGEKAGEIAAKIKKLSFPRAESVTSSDGDVFDAEKLVCWAEEMGKQLGRRKGVDLKTTQIRKFLDAVNTIKSRGTQEKDYYKNQCILLKPKLAYAAGRQDEVKPLMTVLEPCIDKVDSEEDFAHFHRFVEAIVAYHRFYGGD